MNAGHLFVLGATHHTAPLAVREQLSLGTDDAAALAAEVAAFDGMREFTLLNTCNRIEFYGVAVDPSALGRVQAAFCARQRFDPAAFAQFQLELRDGDAVRHLLEVAAGIDSQMIGETEIFGQVKEAYAKAQAHGYTGPILNRVFQKAFQAAKHVRTNTAISAGQVSVANVAVDLAQTIFGKLDGTRTLLVGAGEIGEKTARAFQSRGAGTLTVASRSLEHAMQLATALGASALPYEQRAARLAEFDIVVCATSAPATVLSGADAAAAMRRRPARPLLFVDLALPRDVEAAVAELENVFLYNLDDLAKIADENRAARAAELTKCRTLLSERAAALWQHVAPRLTALAPGSNGVMPPAPDIAAASPPPAVTDDQSAARG
ncbi:MAG TPA: glutamyl-tRNA reductase [Opitutus sp.]|nr:glutamyl-tRNA reductase [Opitutus sp.]